MESRDQEQERIIREVEALPLLSGYRIAIGASNVKLLLVDFDEPERDPTDDELVLLSPGEAVRIARQILAQAERLEALEGEIEAQCEMVSQAVLSLFGETWRRYVAEEQRGRRASIFGRVEPDYTGVTRVLQDVFTRLILDKNGPVRQWWSETYTEQEALFWRYFNRKYRTMVFEQCYPPSEQSDESED